MFKYQRERQRVQDIIVIQGEPIKYIDIRDINCVLVVPITTVEDLTAASAECLASAATNRRRAAKKGHLSFSCVAPATSCLHCLTQLHLHVHYSSKYSLKIGASPSSAVCYAGVRHAS